MPPTNDASAASSGSNGQSTIGEAIYTLTDEQILDIDDAPVPVDVIPSERSESRNPSASPSDAGNQQGDSSAAAAENAASVRNDSQTSPTHDSRPASHQSQVTNHESPPEWLAQAMNDPQQGGPARQFWESAQQSRAQAAQLASLDRAYFGAPGAAPTQLAESREALAQQLLREDPAAFREMLAAGLRALEKSAEPQSHGQNEGVIPNRDARSASQQGIALSPATAPASSAAHESRVTNHESLLAHYVAFERAANDDLDRAVRPEIARVLERALPAGNNEPARATQERLSGLVRTEIETALRQDRALGEQVAQLLRSRTFDDGTRAQVVRLIAARATSLVPAASRRVLAEWTQSALAAHRARRSLTGATGAAREASSSPATAVSPTSSAAKPRPAQTATLGTTHTASRRINYRALSDEEILDL